MVDVLNIRMFAADTRDRKKAYGSALSIQDEIINNVVTVIVNNLRVKGKISLLPVQKDILITNKYLQSLFVDLKRRCSINNYLLTYKLNQDVLENFFGAIRSKGGLHDHPDALEFKYRLRLYILGRYKGSLSKSGNVEDDETPDLPCDESNLCGKYFSLVDNSSEPGETTNMDDRELSEVGYICYKIKQPDCSIESSTKSNNYSWVTHPSEGGLSKPSPEFVACLQELDQLFKSLNSDTLHICNGYLTL